MILEAKHRLTATEPALSNVLQAFAKMTPPQQKSFCDGLIGIIHWYSGDFMGEARDGKLLIAGPKRQHLKSPGADLEHAMNAMKWLTKFFYPDTVTGFSKAYRLHDLLEQEVEEGDIVTIKPLMPISSWTVNPNPEVVDAEFREQEVILSMSSPTVICSFKTIEALNKDYAHLFSREHDKLKATLLDLGIDQKIAETFSLAFDGIIGEYDYTGDSEKELVVYNGGKPYKARVVEIL
jgi:hypothetical protein